MKSDFQDLRSTETMFGRFVNQFFGKWISPADHILDWNMDYGEFIDHTNAIG